MAQRARGAWAIRADTLARKRALAAVDALVGPDVSGDPAFKAAKALEQTQFQRATDINNPDLEITRELIGQKWFQERLLEVAFPKEGVPTESQIDSWKVDNLLKFMEIYKANGVIKNWVTSEPGCANRIRGQLMGAQFVPVDAQRRQQLGEALNRLNLDLLANSASTQLSPGR